MNRLGGLLKQVTFAALSLAVTAGAVRADLPLERAVGQRMSDFTLKNTEGEPVRLYGFIGKKAVVLVFLGTDCPVGNAYLPRLNDLSKKYADQGVVFLGINSNAQESMEKVTAHKKEYGLTFPVLKDPSNLAADLALADRTCEALVLDGRAVIRYRGAIDDQFAVGSRRDKPEHNYVVDALDSILAKKPIVVKATKVEGCPIEKTVPKIAVIKGPRVRGPSEEIAKAYAEKEAKAGPIEVGNVTYAADVASIVQNKCQNCHRPGQSAPFSLLTYDDVKRKSAGIAEVVEERRMPPWHADPRHGNFSNDRSLSPKERAVLLAWVEQGTPLGDAAKIPPARTFAEGWTIGKPDLVIEIPEAYVVPAQGVVAYVHMKAPTNFKQDMWVQAAEAVPGDRSVVHHVVVFIDDHGASRGTGREAQRHLCGYAPGDMPSIYPLGSAKKIPAGSDLIFQLHYTPNGKSHVDRSKVGLIFAKGPVEHQAFTVGIVQQRFVIPAGDSNHEVKSSFTFKKDSHLLAFMPHMHLRGKDFKYTVTFPDGKSEVLLSVPAYDFAWQSYYTLAESRAMPTGTRIDCVAHFDNSKANLANPDPTKTVTWGDQTFEEMMIGYVDFINDEKVGTVTKTAQGEPSAKPTAVASSSPFQKLARLRRAIRGSN